MNLGSTFFILISGISAGVILFQSFVVASSIFKVLPEDNAGILLRNLFPKFFLFLAALSLTGLAIGLVYSLEFFPLIFMQLVNFIFFVICYSFNSIIFIAQLLKLSPLYPSKVSMRPKFYANIFRINACLFVGVIVFR